MQVDWCNFSSVPDVAAGGGKCLHGEVPAGQSGRSKLELTSVSKTSGRLHWLTDTA